MRFLSITFLSITFLSFFFSLQVFAASSVVTETVGQVADHVVTSREVQICSVLEGILFPVKGAPAGLQEVKPSDPKFRNDVTSVLLEVVVAMEAENFNVGSVSADELNAAIAKVDKAVSGKSYWNQLEVSALESKKFITRKLVSKSFLKFKTNSLSGIITDQEAQAYFDKNRSKFGSMGFAAFKENIKTYLAQQQLEERLRSWFEVIKRKYKVKNFISG